MSEFVPFDENLKEILADFLRGSGYVGSDYSYYAFICWFEKGEYLVTDDVLYLRAYVDDGVYYWPPLVKSGSSVTVEQAVLALPDDACFAFCTDKFVADTYGGYYVYTHRDWAEYIYKAGDFISLSGKRYHAKRNHIARFESSYKVSFDALCEGDLDDVARFESDWLAAREFDDKAEESAKREREIVRGWLNAALRGELFCDILRADGKIAGIAIGEIDSAGVGIEMYEKADTSFEGVYSYLANAFAKKHFSECEYINRQEDMGLEGLRKSKLSYYPEFLLEKYILKPAKHVSDCYAERTGRFFEKDTQKVKLSRDKYEFRVLGDEDFDTVYGFLEGEREQLKNKLFFLNYTPEELHGVLKCGGMSGAFFNGELVATCAYDTDKEYGDKLAEICGEKEGRQYYEFGGIMTARKMRGLGISGALCEEVLRRAKENLSPAVLCAVVQFDNSPSLNNLAKLGFRAVTTKPEREYTFTYLTRTI